MNEMLDQILETWHAHNRIMMFTLKQISEAALTSTLSVRGGRDIARQFAHLHMVRVWHLESTNKKLAKGLPKFSEDATPSKKQILACFEKSGAATAAHLQERFEHPADIKSAKRHAIPTLAYFISHESHHRGNIILTMKRCGHKIPDTIKWGIWDWNKFYTKA